MSATTGDKLISFKWKAPLNDGGAPITSYIIYNPSNATEGTSIPLSSLPYSKDGFALIIDGNGRYVFTNTGLVNGTTYTYTLASVNKAGKSPRTAAISGTPSTVPQSAPTFTAVSLNGSIGLSWSFPSTNAKDTGGSNVSSYTLQRGDGTTSILTNTTLNSITINGLTNGTSYSYRLYANNKNGQGLLFATVSATPATVPSVAGLSVTATSLDNSCSVIWTPSETDSTGGSPLRNTSPYTLSITPAPANLGITYTSSTAATITGLVNGTIYTLGVYAHNGASVDSTGVSSATNGRSLLSPTTQVIPLRSPTPPTDFAGVPGNGQVTLTWTAPLIGTSGALPLSYTVTVYTSNESLLSPQPTIAYTNPTDRKVTGAVVSGLFNGTPYKFKVAGVNGATGDLQPTPFSASVTPGTAPSAPTNVLVSQGAVSGSMNVQWDTPATTAAVTGGYPITNYELYITTNGEPLQIFQYVISDLTVNGGTLSKRVDGLTNGVSYSIQVAFKNSLGASGTLGARAPSPATSFTPYWNPSPPTITRAVSKDSAVELTWSAPSDLGGSPLSSYQLSYYTSDPTQITELSNSISPTTTMPYRVGQPLSQALTNAIQYTFLLYATNAQTLKSQVATVSQTPNPPVPGAPTAVTGTSNHAAIDLSWIAPEYIDDASNPTSYSINVYTGISPSLTLVGTIPNVSSTALSYKITSPALSLTNGTAYICSVVSRVDNPVTGSQTASESVKSSPITPANVPNAPVVTASRTVNSNNPVSGSITLTWTAPISNGSAIQTYTVAVYDSNRILLNPNPTVTYPEPRTQPGAIISQLTNGISYSFVVTAKNGATPNGGVSPPSADVTSIPASNPIFVSAATVAVDPDTGDSTVYATWNRITGDGVKGSSIASYTLTVAPSVVGASIVYTTPTDTTKAGATITGLAVGTAYTVSVMATNAEGYTTLTPITSGPVTPYTLPRTPTGFTVTRGDGRVTFSYDASTSATNGGNPVTEYLLNVKTAQDVVLTGSPFSYTVGVENVLNGLTNGTPYTFTLQAKNKRGPGPATASVSVTPASVPPPVTGLSAIRTLGTTGAPLSGACSLSWTSGGTGGDTPSSIFYTVTVSPSAGSILYPTDRTATNASITGLADGTTYTIAVTARNSVGAALTSPSITFIPATLPGAPQDLTSASTLGGNALSLSWVPPSSNGGFPLTSYTITATPAVGTTITYTLASADFASNTLNGKISYTTQATLTNGTVYAVQVFANTQPTNPSANFTTPTTPLTQAASTTVSNSTVPATVPSSPLGLTADLNDSSSLLRWNIPNSNGGSTITSYLVDVSGNSDNYLRTFDTRSSDLSFLVESPPLINGNTYTFQVRSVNRMGNSSVSSSVQKTPAKKPDQITASTVLSLASSVSVRWTPPNANGNSITTYTIRVYNTSDVVLSDFTKTVSASTLTPDASGNVSTIVTGLTNGTTYKFGILATNVAGTSSESILVSSTPATYPGIPSITTLDEGNGQITVNWNAPTLDGDGIPRVGGNGGSPITSYTVRSYINATGGSPISETVSTGLSVIVTGLTNGTNYYFTVVAQNGANVSWNTVVGETPNGQSREQVNRTNLQPFTTPEPPTDVSGSVTNGSATLLWKPSTTLTGGTIDSYTIRQTSGGVSSTVLIQASTLTANVGTGLYTYTLSPLTNGTVYLVSISTTTKYTNGTKATTTSYTSSYSPSTPLSLIPLPISPNAPAIQTSSSGNGTLTLNWTWNSSTDTGGGTFVSYQVQLTTTNSSISIGSIQPVQDVNTKTQTITGLTGGVSYTATVLVNTQFVYGTPNQTLLYASPPSSSQTIAVNSSPSSVQNITVTPGKRSATISWNAPTSSGNTNAISTLTYSGVVSGAGTFTLTQGLLAASITGLTYGTQYTATITATNTSNLTSTVTSSSFTPTATAPGVVTGISGTVSKGSVTLTWVAPADDGGAAITSYTVTSADGGTVVYPNLGSATISGLTNGTTHAFTVIATNVLGSSSPVSYTATFPVVAPEPPTGLTVIAGQRQLGIQWTAPLITGGVSATITGYTVVCTTSTGTIVGTVAYPQGTTGSSATVTGLTYGTTYTLTVTVTNSSSLSSSVSTTGTPSAVAPADPAFSKTETVRGNASITVKWATPVDVLGSTIVDGGAALAFYVVSCSPAPAAPNPSSYTIDGSASTVSSIFPQMFSGLTPGTAYTFSCVAKNAAELSSPGGQAYKETAIGAPGVPTAVYGVSGKGSVTVTWTAPTSDLNSPTKSYTVTPSPVPPTGTASRTTTDNGTSLVYSGLTNGTVYTFTVRTTNSDSLDSAESIPSSAIIPVTNPGAPTWGTRTPSNGKAILQWAAPTFTGGADISYYTVSCSNGTTTRTQGENPPTSMMYTGLTNGTPYTFTITATNTYRDNSGNVISYTSVPSASTDSITPAPDPPPMPILETTTTVLHTAAIIRWKAPIDDGGTTITNYKVWYRTGDFPNPNNQLLTGTAFQSLDDPTGNFTANKDAVTGVFSYKVTGLTNGTAYKFKVTAKNSINALDSFPSMTQVIVTPAIQAPDALATPTLTTTLETITVTWAAYNTTGYTVPNTNGATINNYTITYSYTNPTTGNAASGTATATSSPSTINGLTYGVTYTITVKANYTIGTTTGSSPDSPPSSIQVTPVKPNTPVFVSNTPGKRQITVTWAPPFNGGRTITSYTLCCIDQTTSTDAIGTVLDASGNRVNGNAVSPFILSDASGNFTANKVTSTDVNLQYTFTGLSYSTTYKFTILATNSVDPSLVSAQYPTDAVRTSVTIPTKVTSLTITSRYSSYYLRWKPPTDDGGADTLYYFITNTNQVTPVTYARFSPHTDASGINPYIYSPTKGFMYAFNTGTKQLVKPPDSIDTYTTIGTGQTTSLTSGKIAINDTTKNTFIMTHLNNLYVTYTYTLPSVGSFAKINVNVYASTNDIVTSSFNEVSAVETKEFIFSNTTQVPDPPLLNYFTTTNYTTNNYSDTVTSPYATVSFEYPYYIGMSAGSIYTRINRLYVSTDNGTNYMMIGSFTGVAAGTTSNDPNTKIQYTMTAATKFIPTINITYSTVTYTIYFNTPTYPIGLNDGKGPRARLNTSNTTYPTIHLYPGTEYSYFIELDNGSSESEKILIGKFRVNGLPEKIDSTTISSENILAVNPSSTNLPGATLKWNAPTYQGNASGVTSYTVKVYKGTASSAATPDNIETTGTISFTLSSTTCRATIPSLKFGQSYIFGVIATNSHGSSPETIHAPTTAFQTETSNPDPPTNFAGTYISPGTSITLTWTASTFIGAASISKYNILYAAGGTEINKLYSTTADETTITITYQTGLVAGTQYTFFIECVNSANKKSTRASITPINYPSIITFPNNPTTLINGIMNNTVATTTYPSATIRWNVPNNGGSPIVSYTVKITYTYNSLPNSALFVIPFSSSDIIYTDDTTKLSISISTTGTIVTGTLNNLIFGSLTNNVYATPATTYKISIKSNNSSYETAYNTEINLTSQTLTPPIINDIPDDPYTNNGTSITLNWNDPTSTVYPFKGSSTSFTYKLNTTTNKYFTYQVYYGTTIPPTTLLTAPTNSATITLLTPGVQYYFGIITRGIVTMTSTTSISSPLSELYYPINYPASPASPSVISSQKDNFRIRFTTPGNGGGTITTYTVTLYSGSTAAIAQGSNATFVSIELTDDAIDTTTTLGSTILQIPSTNVSVGTFYTYSINCYNGTYTSSNSTRTTIAVPCIPEPPTTVTLSLYTGVEACYISVQWTDPILNDNTFDSYEIQYKLHSASSWTTDFITSRTQRNYTIDAINASIRYNIKIKTNSIYKGTQNPSLFSDIFTVISGSTGKPGSITTFTKNPTTTQNTISISWNAPTCTGGAAITSYEVKGYTLSQSGAYNGTSVVSFPTTTSVSFNGTVTKGVTYYFSIVAKTNNTIVANRIGEVIIINIPCRPHEPIAFTALSIKYSSINTTINTIYFNATYTITRSQNYNQEINIVTRFATQTTQMETVIATNAVSSTLPVTFPGSNVSIGVRYANGQPPTLNYNFYIKFHGYNRQTPVYVSSEFLVEIPVTTNTTTVYTITVPPT